MEGKWLKCQSGYLRRSRCFFLSVSFFFSSTFPENTFVTYFFTFYFWPCCTAGGILQPGIEPAPLAVKAWSPNHWTTGEFPKYIYIFFTEDFHVLACLLYLTFM